jgi:hypothetical protein
MKQLSILAVLGLLAVGVGCAATPDFDEAQLEAADEGEGADAQSLVKSTTIRTEAGNDFIVTTRRFAASEYRIHVRYEDKSGYYVTTLGGASQPAATIRATLELDITQFVNGPSLNQDRATRTGRREYVTLTRSTSLGGRVYQGVISLRLAAGEVVHGAGVSFLGSANNAAKGDPQGPSSREPEGRVKYQVPIGVSSLEPLVTSGRDFEGTVTRSTGTAAYGVNAFTATHVEARLPEGAGNSALPGRRVTQRLRYVDSRNFFQGKGRIWAKANIEVVRGGRCLSYGGCPVERAEISFPLALTGRGVYDGVLPIPVDLEISAGSQQILFDSVTYRFYGDGNGIEDSNFDRGYRITPGIRTDIPLKR